MHAALLSSFSINLPRRLARSSIRRRRRRSSAAARCAAAGEFQWDAQWYPLAPAEDLDKRRPHARRVLGRDVVVWWDGSGAGEWRVFDDACPHRLAPLSEGRIDPRGRLQCVYHGWCFAGDGACGFVPQAPALGPPVHENPRACVRVYPSVEQNRIVWFWASADPQYRDIADRKKPPFIPELDDPSFTSSIGSRDLLYGYEVLIENLMDPAHVPYVHKGLMGGIRRRPDPGRVEFDREGGGPVEIKILDRSIDGFAAKQEHSVFHFVAPSLFYGRVTMSSSTKRSKAGMHDRSFILEAAVTMQIRASFDLVGTCKEGDDEAEGKQKRFLLIFMCIPVSPGASRVMYAFPRNFAVLLDRLVPRWIYHLSQNLILDSDLHLLHVEERKLLSAGVSNWHKACYVPTSSDNMVIAFRTWLRLYSGNRVGWPGDGTDITSLPPTPPKEQLLDRYWSHVVHCPSCSGALRALKAAEVALQVVCIAAIGGTAVAAARMPLQARAAAVAMAVVCLAASRWLSVFIYRSFYFQDYNHAFK